MAEKIKVTMIVEMLGKPASFLIENLDKHVENMKLEKGVSLISKRISEPKPVEETDMLTSFAEIELEIDDVNNLLRIVFIYMPSHVEITSGSFRINNFDLTVFCNELASRLHSYDSIARIAQIQNDQLTKQLAALNQAPNKSREKAVKKKAIKKKK
jgi:hypothetical protein